MQQHHEDIGAEATHNGGVRKRLDQTGGSDLQRVIPSGVPKGVVDQLEAIQPDKDQGLGGGLAHQILESTRHFRSVRQPGQRVAVGRELKVGFMRTLVRDVTARNQDPGDRRMVQQVVHNGLKGSPGPEGIDAHPKHRHSSRESTGDDPAEFPIHPRTVIGVDQIEHPAAEQTLRSLFQRVGGGIVDIEQRAVFFQHGYRGVKAVSHGTHVVTVRLAIRTLRRHGGQLAPALRSTEWAFCLLD
jgi:hypothetical protein